MRQADRAGLQSISLTGMLYILVGLLILLAIGGAVSSASAQSRRHPRHGGLPGSLLSEMQASVTLVEVQPDLKLKRAQVARNASRTYEAFVLTVPIDGDENNLREVIFIEDKRKGKTYEVRGFDFPRPFTDLAWRGSHTLVFDQWMQPHYAVHYEINLRRSSLTAAAPFWERGFEP